MDAHPAVEVHFSSHLPADLDRLEVALEGFRQRTLHQSLEAVLELLESHGSPNPTGTGFGFEVSPSGFPGQPHDFAYEDVD